MPKGEWSILSINVDNQSVHNSEGFERIEMSDNVMTIRPAGMKFTVQHVTERTAVLESQGQVFFADYKTSRQDQQLNLRLTRPQFAETIDIRAQIQDWEIWSLIVIYSERILLLEIAKFYLPLFGALHAIVSEPFFMR